MLKNGKILCSRYILQYKDNLIVINIQQEEGKFIIATSVIVSFCTLDTYLLSTIHYEPYTCTFWNKFIF